MRMVKTTCPYCNERGDSIAVSPTSLTIERFATCSVCGLYYSVLVQWEPVIESYPLPDDSEDTPTE